MALIVVRATWDPEAKVFVATSDDIGIATEAPTLAELEAKLPAMIQDLLDEEGGDWDDVPVEIIAHTSMRVRNAA